MRWGQSRRTLSPAERVERLSARFHVKPKAVVRGIRKSWPPCPSCDGLRSPRFGECHKCYRERLFRLGLVKSLGWALVALREARRARRL